MLQTDMVVNSKSQKHLLIPSKAWSARDETQKELQRKVYIKGKSSSTSRFSLLTLRHKTYFKFELSFVS